MGDVYVKLGIAGVTTEGDMIPERALRREALVDTGSTMTLVSREVAELAEIVVNWKRPDFFSTAGGRMERFWPAFALVQVAGCRLLQMTVGVTDSLSDEDASILLGHDYMQRTRMIISPADRKAGCHVQPSRTKPAKRARTTTARKRTGSTKREAARRRVK